jgi:uncharacterized membrane protein
MNKKDLQAAYGVVLIMVGLGVFYRIPAVMEKVKKIEYFANASILVKSGFYLLGFLVILAGVIKIYRNKVKYSDSRDS